MQGRHELIKRPEEYLVGACGVVISLQPGLAEQVDAPIYNGLILVGEGF
jgi:hypothetical protein